MDGVTDLPFEFPEIETVAVELSTAEIAILNVGVP